METLASTVRIKSFGSSWNDEMLLIQIPCGTQQKRNQTLSNGTSGSSVFTED